MQRRLKRESQALDKQQLKQQLRQQLKIQQKQERQRLARATAEALTKAAKASKATKASKGKVQSIVCCPAAMLDHLPMLGMYSYIAHASWPFESPGDRHRDTCEGHSSLTARSKPKYNALGWAKVASIRCAVFHSAVSDRVLFIAGPIQDRKQKRA